MKQIALLAIGLLLTARTGSANDSFAKANAEFGAGNFKYAVNDYQNAVKTGQWSANLFYDLGNAWYRDGDQGRAILNYERALRLEPHHPETEANLRIAREEARALELAPSRLERYLSFAARDDFAIAAAAFFWLAVLLLVWRPRGGMLALAILVFIASGGCAFAAFTLENAERGRAIVIAPDAAARVATADSARSVMELPKGSEVRILEERGDWDYAALPNGQRGWVDTKAVERIRL